MNKTLITLSDAITDRLAELERKEAERLAADAAVEARNAELCREFAEVLRKKIGEEYGIIFTHSEFQRWTISVNKHYATGEAETFMVEIPFREMMVAPMIDRTRSRWLHPDCFRVVEGIQRDQLMWEAWDPNDPEDGSKYYRSADFVAVATFAETGRK